MPAFSWRHSVAALDVGLLERQNQKRLDACKRHQWIEVEGRKFTTFRCMSCGGEVDATLQNVYTPVNKVEFRPACRIT
jgi:hypothetical protein